MREARKLRSNECYGVTNVLWTNASRMPLANVFDDLITQ
jgi:hypothetical protein